jgi:hypothetical protein
MCAVTARRHVPHMASCIRFVCSVFHLSLHVHTGQTWLWDSCCHWMYNSDLSRSFSALWWRNSKHTPSSFDIYVCPSACNNSQSIFYKFLHFSQLLRFSGWIIKAILKSLETVMLQNCLHYTHPNTLDLSNNVKYNYMFAKLCQNTYSKWILHHKIILVWLAYADIKR